MTYIPLNEHSKNYPPLTERSMTYIPLKEHSTNYPPLTERSMTYIPLNEHSTNYPPFEGTLYDLHPVKRTLYGFTPR